MAERTWDRPYFYGADISDYGKKNGYVDYGALSHAVGDMILNNNVINYGGEWELENGTEYDEENDYYYDIYQYYIITGQGADILKEWTDEIVYYNYDLNMYLWGVTHFGTAWTYVLTDIKLVEQESE